MTYHDDLIKDKKRVSIFKRAIQDKAQGKVYDLGTGSGILAQIASQYADEVLAFEINPLIIKRITKKNLEKYSNITLYNEDASTYEYKIKPDVVICEMLDTALIDEEQVPVINNILQYSKEDTIFIPQSTTDTIQLIFTKINNITYHENNKPEYEEYSKETTYNTILFSSHINPSFDKEITIKANKKGIINAIKLTTYTQLTQKLITGPTPMLNPPLLIPVKETKVNYGQIIRIKLQYTMGGGLNTIKANIL